MNDITFNILKIVVAICTALISAYLIPYIRTQLHDKKYENLLTIIEVAVRAAEQTITGSGQGKIKKEEVVQFVTAWMIEHGIMITQEQLSQLIEAAVYNMNRESL